MKKIKSLFITSVLVIGILIYAASTLGIINTPISSAAGMKKFQPTPWPPVIDQAYPDLELIDQNGKPFHLSDLKGKVIIIEPVGMSCAACQAFSGAHEVGPFQNNPVQGGLLSFKEMVRTYAGGIKIPRRDIVFIQLILYDMQLQAPLPVHAQTWAEHFDFRTNENEIIAVSPYDLRSNVSYNLIPGFQLIDKNFILRSDSTGHNPRDDLYRMLLPMIPVALR